MIANGQTISPDTINTPLKNTPARSNVPDSGYSSFNSTPFSSTSTNRHNSSFPRSKLFPDSPVKHDVYRPNSLNKYAAIHDNKVASSSKNHHVNPSAVHENSEEKDSNIVPPSVVNIKSQTLVNQHIEQSPQNTKPALTNIADTASLPTSQPPTTTIHQSHLPDLTTINPPEPLNQPSKPDSPEPTSKPVPHNTKQPLSQSCNTTAIPELVDTDYPLPQPFSPTKPNTSNLPANDLLLGPAKPKNKKKNKKVKFSKVPPNPHPPNPIVKSSDSGSTLDSKSINIIPTPNTVVISEKSKNGNIITLNDPTSPKYYPQDEQFNDRPDNLPVDPDGCLDSTLRADRMKTLGRCRFCKEEVYSYKADYHLLACKRLQQEDVDEFANEYAEITTSSYGDIITVIYDYCENIMHDEEISFMFQKLATFRKFLNDLESILDRKASKIF